MAGYNASSSGLDVAGYKAVAGDVDPGGRNRGMQP
jgi:hypothetical protein